MNVEQNNIKATLTTHGFNDCSQAQKVSYLIKGIKTNLVYTCLTNASGSEFLCDDFALAARHVAEFLMIMKSRDLGSNHNILGVDTDQGGGSGRWREGRPGNGG